MFKRLFLTGLALLFIVGCGDPAVKAYKTYLYQLSELQTYVRAAHKIYDDSKGKSELIRASSIKSKVLGQYRKYNKGLLRIKSEDAFVKKLNDKGINLTEKAIKNLQVYHKVLLQRNTHDVLKARTDAEQSVQNVKNWLIELREYAREKGLDMPGDNVKK